MICAGLWISSNHQQEPEEASASEAHMMILMVLLQVGFQPVISVEQKMEESFKRK